MLLLLLLKLVSLLFFIDQSEIPSLGFEQRVYCSMSLLLLLKRDFSLDRNVCCCLAEKFHRPVKHHVLVYDALKIFSRIMVVRYFLGMQSVVTKYMKIFFFP